MLSMRIYQRHGNCHSFVSIPARSASFLFFPVTVACAQFEQRTTADIVCSSGLRPFLCKFGFIYCRFHPPRFTAGCVNLFLSTALEVARRYEFYLGWVSSGIVVVHLACLQNPERFSMGRHILD